MELDEPIMLPARRVDMTATPGELLDAVTELHKVLTDHNFLNWSNPEDRRLALELVRKKRGDLGLDDTQFAGLLGMDTLPPLPASESARAIRMSEADKLEEMKLAAEMHQLDLSVPADRARAVRIILHNKPALRAEFTDANAPATASEGERALLFTQTAAREGLDFDNFEDRLKVAEIVAREHPSAFPAYGYAARGHGDALTAARREVAEKFALPVGRVPDGLLFTERPDLRPTIETARTSVEAVQAVLLRQGYLYPTPEQRREAAVIAARERPELEARYGAVPVNDDGAPARFHERGGDPLVARLEETRRRHGLPADVAGRLEASRLLASEDRDAAEEIARRSGAGRS